ncbi:unnamed protein product [Mytilus edulis]|uniref:Uncharacterized protein n=1 Tax=Mytilus edulis TaxID=6550 RepID=A0A8S3V7S6_MYTED|nr:unnamed protein product [Mytilus edulis]
MRPKLLHKSKSLGDLDFRKLGLFKESTRCLLLEDHYYDWIALSELDDSSAKMNRVKHHLSPSNLSRNSGLTLSDAQLYDDDGSMENLTDRKLYNRSISQYMDRDSDKLKHSEIVNRSYDTAYENPKPPLRKNKKREYSNEKDKVAKSVKNTMHQSYSAEGYQKYKRASAESLQSLEDHDNQRVTPYEFLRQSDYGTLIKSSSGAYLFLDENNRESSNNNLRYVSEIEIQTQRSPQGGNGKLTRQASVTEKLSNPTKRSGSHSYKEAEDIIKPRFELSTYEFNEHKENDHLSPILQTKYGSSASANDVRQNLPLKAFTKYGLGTSPPPGVVLKLHQKQQKRDNTPMRASHDSAIISQVRRNSTDSSGSDQKREHEFHHSELNIGKLSTPPYPLVKSDSDSDINRTLSNSPNRPDRPPSYDEACQRTFMLKHGIPLEISEQDSQKQKEASLLAKQLYEESLRKYMEEHLNSPSVQNIDRKEISRKEEVIIEQEEGESDSSEGKEEETTLTKKDPKKIWEESMKAYEQIKSSSLDTSSAKKSLISDRSLLSLFNYIAVKVTHQKKAGIHVEQKETSVIRDSAKPRFSQVLRESNNSPEQSSSKIVGANVTSKVESKNSIQWKSKREPVTTPKRDSSADLPWSVKNLRSVFVNSNSSGQSSVSSSSESRPPPPPYQPPPPFRRDNARMSSSSNSSCSSSNTDNSANIPQTKSSLSHRRLGGPQAHDSFSDDSDTSSRRNSTNNSSDQESWTYLDTEVTGDSGVDGAPIGPLAFIVTDSRGNNFDSNRIFEQPPDFKIEYCIVRGATVNELKDVFLQRLNSVDTNRCLPIIVKVAVGINDFTKFIKNKNRERELVYSGAKGLEIYEKILEFKAAVKEKIPNALVGFITVPPISCKKYKEHCFENKKLTVSEISDDDLLKFQKDLEKEVELLNEKIIFGNCEKQSGHLKGCRTISWHRSFIFVPLIHVEQQVVAHTL